MKCGLKERLTSSRIDEVWHAHYPTGELTLCCGFPVPAFTPGRKRAPTCDECVRVSRLFHAIDQSCPPFWTVKISVGERALERALQHAEAA